MKGKQLIPKKILDELKNFYSGLYKKRFTKTEQACMQYLAYKNTPKLSEEKQKQCEGKLTLKEIWNSFASMKNGKSPGINGMSKNSVLHFLVNLVG